MPNVRDHTVFSMLMTAEQVDAWDERHLCRGRAGDAKPASDDALEVGQRVKPEKKAA
jgi:hypothetical protein